MDSIAPNSRPKTPAFDLARAFVFLFLFWLLLNGSLAPDVLLAGALVALVIALPFRDGIVVATEFRLGPRALVATLLYLSYFLLELVKSNLALAVVVLSPRMPLDSGIVKVRTKLKSRMGRYLLAHSITLTPGTLTVELNGEWLYVHWVRMRATDTDEATRRIVTGFERYLEVMYG